MNQVTKVDYADQSRPASKSLLFALSGFGIGCFATGPALLLAILSGGAGHGHYGFARAIFPFEMLGTLLTGREITMPLIIAACIQLPIYGIILGYGLSRRDAVLPGTLAILHGMAVLFCFSDVIPNFS